MKPTLGSLVAAQPALGPVFESLGLDYCCGGHRTLAQAAQENGLDERTLERALAAFGASASPPPSAERPAAFDSARLIDHIVSTHHAYVRAQLPRLVALSAKVARVHGPGHPQLLQLEQGVKQLADSLLEHLDQEERVLFPALKALAPNARLQESELAHFRAEHEEAGALFSEFRELTGGYEVPDWACVTYKTLMLGLRGFETDLHEHVHLENNVLFARLAG